MYTNQSTRPNHSISHSVADKSEQIDATTSALLSRLDDSDLRLINDLRAAIPDLPKSVEGGVAAHLSSAVAV